MSVLSQSNRVVGAYDPSAPRGADAFSGIEIIIEHRAPDRGREPQTRSGVVLDVGNSLSEGFLAYFGL